MSKVICESCGSSFPFGVIKEKKFCPVCNHPLFDDMDEVEDVEPEKDETLSFGEGIELSENDSFDEDKIDFWWYSIREPGTLGETDRGSISTTCAKCGQLTGSVPYYIAKTGNYLLIDPRFHDRCRDCGNEMKNHILSKRPTDWVDTRKLDMWKRDENVPRCPICSSTKVHKISLTNKAASAIAFGVLAAGHVSKTYKCDICGSKF